MSKTIFYKSFLFLTLFCVRGTNSAVREPAVAGTFYPADSIELRQVVANHLDNVENLLPVKGELLALIVPHAGLVYSGQIAAYSYKLLENTGFENIILCGPSHRFGFEGVSVYGPGVTWKFPLETIYGPGITWKTPLGTIKCNDSLCNHLIKQNKYIDIIEQAHTREHSLEVQLPYLQTVLPECQIVPMVMGYQDNNSIDILAKALETLNFDGKVLMIASTDWQHYRSSQKGWKMDSLGINCLEKLNPDLLARYLRSGEVEMCGGGPTVAVLKAAIAKGANRVKILRYGDSGDVTGDKSSVVAYVAAAIYKSSEAKKGKKRGILKAKGDEAESSQTFQLTAVDKRKLLEIARQSIESNLAGSTIPEFEVSDILKTPGAAFVTLNKKGRLRGCIGRTVAIMPLYKCVSICAVQAAREDPRFFQVQPEELTDIDIEISVLTPLREVESLDNIKVGRDGLMIFLGDRRGLLLPQVATEYGWDRIQFLEQTCRKAGLPKDAYLSPDASIYSFEAIVFGEKEMATH